MKYEFLLNFSSNIQPPFARRDKWVRLNKDRTQLESKSDPFERLPVSQNGQAQRVVYQRRPSLCMYPGSLHHHPLSNVISCVLECVAVVKNDWADCVSSFDSHTRLVLHPFDPFNSADWLRSIDETRSFSHSSI